MDWKSGIKGILGRFWSLLFKDRDFLLSVENVESMFGQSQEMALSNWLSERIQASVGAVPSSLPYAIDIDVSSVHRKYASIYEITTGSKTFGQYSSDSEWMTDDIVGVEPPDAMTDHVEAYGVVLVGGIDYMFHDGRLSFYRDPATLGLPTVKISDSDGTLHVYYRLFGWKSETALNNDAVSGFVSKELAAYAPTAWDIHVNGASVINASRLLAEVTNGAVASSTGFVSDVWTEQGTRYMLIGDTLYSAPSSVQCNKSTGDAVTEGDVLFGTLKVYTGSSTPAASEIPGIRVMTDAGELTAPNRSIDVTGTQFHDTTTGYNYLPLEGDAATVAAYVARCKEIAADPRSLFCDIPTVVNPFLFVKNTLRRRRSCFMTLAADQLQDVEPALDCIRKSTSCSAVVTVFMRATGEQIGATVSGFTAQAGNAAVSEYATLKLINDSAEANRLV